MTTRTTGGRRHRTSALGLADRVGQALGLGVRRGTRVLLEHRHGPERGRPHSGVRVDLVCTHKHKHKQDVKPREAEVTKPKPMPKH